MQPILRAPQVTQYRNRVDFTIGFDAAGRPVTGHLMGLFREGVMDVVPPDDLPMPSAIAVAYAALMTRFLNSDSSSLPAWNKAAAHSSPARFLHPAPSYVMPRCNSAVTPPHTVAPTLAPILSHGR